MKGLHAKDILEELGAEDDAGVAGVEAGLAQYILLQHRENHVELGGQRHLVLLQEGGQGTVLLHVVVRAPVGDVGPYTLLLYIGRFVFIGSMGSVLTS